MALDQRIVGFVDDAHRPAAQFAPDFVLAELTSRVMSSPRGREPAGLRRADRRLADCARLRAAAGAAEGAEDPGDLAERTAVESLLRGRNLLGLQDVEFHDVLGGLELAHAQDLA